jgi:hypothetical protein
MLHISLPLPMLFLPWITSARYKWVTLRKRRSSPAVMRAMRNICDGVCVRSAKIEKRSRAGRARLNGAAGKHWDSRPFVCFVWINGRRGQRASKHRETLCRQAPERPAGRWIDCFVELKELKKRCSANWHNSRDDGRPRAFTRPAGIQLADSLPSSFSSSLISLLRSSCGPLLECRFPVAPVIAPFSSS